MRKLRYIVLVSLLALAACKGGVSAAQYPASPSAAANARHHGTPDPTPTGHHEYGTQVREYRTGGHHPGAHPMKTPTATVTLAPPRTPTPPRSGTPMRTRTWTPKPTRTWTPKPTATVTPYPDNTSADPVNLGTETLTYDDADGDACAVTSEGLPVPEGLNASGTQAWYEFTLGALNPACPQPEIAVEVVGNTSSSGYFGVAATASGVDPDTPFGTVYHLPWPEDGGTFYIEVIGTGYFSIPDP